MVVLPMLSEQRVIPAVLFAMDAEMGACEQRLDRTRAVRKGMMQRLKAGVIWRPIPEEISEPDLRQ